ncbi:MAG: chemotaxis protein CheW [Pleurocapsa sp.]
MSNLTININSNLIASNKNKSIKLLTFDIDKLTLALPILHVQKVIKYNPVHGSGLSYVNLVHLEDKDIAVVDLYKKIFKINLPEAIQTQGYFIISQEIAEEPLGILISQPPALIDVPTTQVRLIPDSYRHADTLAIASHVTVIPQANGSDRTIFILDLAKLI